MAVLKRWNGTSWELVTGDSLAIELSECKIIRGTVDAGTWTASQYTDLNFSTSLQEVVVHTETDQTKLTIPAGYDRAEFTLRVQNNATASACEVELKQNGTIVAYDSCRYNATYNVANLTTGPIVVAPGDIFTAAIFESNNTVTVGSGYFTIKLWKSTGAVSADSLTLDSSLFSGHLSTADNTIQKALATLESKNSALDLADIPDAYGTPGQVLRVNATQDGLEFGTPATGALKYASNIGDASAVNYVVTHNLDTVDVSITVRQTAAPYAIIYPGIEIIDANSVRIKFTTAPALDEFRVVVMG